MRPSVSLFPSDLFAHGHLQVTEPMLCEWSKWWVHVILEALHMSEKIGYESGWKAVHKGTT